MAKVKVHGRESAPGAIKRFGVRAVVDETRELLAHRLRATSSTLEFTEEPRDVSLVGDPARLGQVLVNLVANAIDAYEEIGVSGERATNRIRATRRRSPTRSSRIRPRGWW